MRMIGRTIAYHPPKRQSKNDPHAAEYPSGRPPVTDPDNHQRREQRRQRSAKPPSAGDDAAGQPARAQRNPSSDEAAAGRIAPRLSQPAADPGEQERPEARRQASQQREG